MLKLPEDDVRKIETCRSPNRLYVNIYIYIYILRLLVFLNELLVPART